MATYASTSNPFIKPNELSPNRSLCKKDAPGMARPQSLSMKQKEVNLMNLNVDNSDPLSVKIATNIQLAELDNDGDGEDEKMEKSCCAITSHKDYDSLEITQACESLVEMTVKLELEERKRIDSGGTTSVSDAAIGFEGDKMEERKEVSRTIEKNPKAFSKRKLFVEDEDAEEELDAEVDDDNELAPMDRDDRQHQHIELIKKLRLQLRDLEKYAYERGELDQVPPSVLAERQSVILDTLKERLSLNISRGEIERLDLDELKKQIDKEIHDLIDPLMTKENLLSQLKTQLTDLERYITHLHGSLSKIHDKKGCLCHIHGCGSPSPDLSTSAQQDENNNSNNSGSNSTKGSSLITNEALPKTSRLIRSLVTQLICSDIKLREKAEKEKEFERAFKKSNNIIVNGAPKGHNQNSNDNAAWSLHIDQVILATDSLVNLFTIDTQPQRKSTTIDKTTTVVVDDSLIESIVRRQLIPAIRDLLSYGIIDPNSLPRSTSYLSFLFDPYYILSSLTCFPSSQNNSTNNNSSSSASSSSTIKDKIHIWNIIEDYYDSKNEPGFKSSSAKTLSQSFNLPPSSSGPIKITSKQALLIAIEDIIETLTKCKPNGPESHLKSFIYTGLNRGKLPTWLRLIFRNKSIIRKYYYNFSFVSQADKMDKLLSTLAALNQFGFKLRTDVESIEQFISAF